MTTKDEALAWDRGAGMLSCRASIMCGVSSSGRLMILPNRLFMLNEALQSPAPASLLLVAHVLSSVVECVNSVLPAGRKSYARPSPSKYSELSHSPPPRKCSELARHL